MRCKQTSIETDPIDCSTPLIVHNARDTEARDNEGLQATLAGRG